MDKFPLIELTNNGIKIDTQFCSDEIWQNLLKDMIKFFNIKELSITQINSQINTDGLFTNSLSNIERLEVKGNCIEYLTLDSTSNSIKYLNLNNCSLKHIIGVRNLKNLESIDISDNPFKRNHEFLLNHLNSKNLKKLTANNIGLKYNSFSEANFAFPKLESLKLNNNALHQRGVNELFDKIKLFDNLKILELNNCQIENIQTELFKNHFLNLKTLHLKGNKLDFTFYTHLKDILEAPNLSELDLSGNNLQTLEGKAIVKILQSDLRKIPAKLVLKEHAFTAEVQDLLKEAMKKYPESILVLS